tara:strand:+ start:1125 stop:2486 length:1362 start_codon:yes stop_codon:yes gene_type:complete
MSAVKFIETVFRNFFPSPFTIAIFLTLLIILIATLFTDESIGNIIYGWEKGLWNSGLLSFTTQMMLMLVLGHSVALTKVASKSISNITKFCRNTSSAASIVSFFSILISLFNWGLGLIFGAILARKVGESSMENNIKINYPLIGAAGYSGLMVWHGGLSGSATLKISEKNHFNEIISNETLIKALPENIDFSNTVFSNMNIFVSLLLIIFIPTLFMIIGKISKKESTIKLKKMSLEKSFQEKGEKFLAEKLDGSNFLGTFIGGSILLLSIAKIFISESLEFINPNYINLTLFGLALFLHSNINNFLKSISIAIKGASGILIQFPLYFGIMGIMTTSGLVSIFSDFFVRISTDFTYPIYTMISAGIVNIFVPSGGGQWAVQAPIILQAAHELSVPFEKTIMAFVYGDQLTNMLQPFWALPLLGITALKARQILPYTILIMLCGLFIFLLGIILF